MTKGVCKRLWLKNPKQGCPPDKKADEVPQTEEQEVFHVALTGLYGAESKHHLLAITEADSA